MFAGLGVGDNMAITSLRALLFTAGGVVAVGGVAYLSGAFEKPATPPATQAEAPAQSTPETAAPEAPAPDTKEAKTASGTQERVPAASAGDGQAEPQNTQAENTPPQAAAQTPATAVVAPTFDVVRIEGNGSAVIAGKAVAGAKVEIVHGSIVLGETTAGADGTFAIVLNDPLKPGDYQIVLRSTAPDGVVATSEQTAVISVPEKADGQVLAMVEEPGKPAELLTVPESQKKEPDAAGQQAAEQPAEASGENAAPKPAPEGEQAEPQAAAPAAEQPAEANKPAATPEPVTTVAGPACLASSGNTASIACGLTATTSTDGEDGKSSRFATALKPCWRCSSAASPARLGS